MKHSPALPAAWMALRILVVLNWIFGAFLLVLLAATFGAEEWTWRALGVGTVVGHERLAAAMRGIIVIGILGVPLALVVLHRLLDIVASVRAGAPFSAENAARLQTI